MKNKNKQLKIKNKKLKLKNGKYMSKNLIKNVLIGTLLFLIFVICSSVVCLDTPKHIESEQTEFEQT
ncbi:MAG: hypothetical protein ACFFAN_02330 [Promethearchaeota archaeon]